MLIRRPIDYRVAIARFLLEACLEMGLAAIICVKMMEKENFSHFWEALSTISSFICLACLVAAPFYHVRIRNQFLQELNRDPGVLSRF